MIIKKENASHEKHIYGISSCEKWNSQKIYNNNRESGDDGHTPAPWLDYSEPVYTIMASKPVLLLDVTLHGARGLMGIAEKMLRF